MVGRLWACGNTISETGYRFAAR